jgi:CBS domain-containing protein
VQVHSLLDAKGTAVATIGREATVAAAVAELRRRRIGALVVSPDGRHIDGIVSERDVVAALAVRGADLLDEPVSALMSVSVHTCRPDDEVETLMAAMTDRRVRHVPVVDATGALAGMVSIGDVVKVTIDALRRDRDQLVDYIQAR